MMEVPTRERSASAWKLKAVLIWGRSDWKIGRSKNAIDAAYNARTRGSRR